MKPALASWKMCLILTFVNAVLSASPNETGADFVHPGISHSAAELVFVKAKLPGQEQPWQKAWEQLRASREASLDWQPKPRAHVQRGARNKPNIGSSDMSRDSQAAYTHALLWVFTDQEAHARKAAEIIDAWSETLASVTNHDARLLVGMVGIKFVNAAELLKHTWEGWPQDRQAAFAGMLRQVWYPVIKDFYPSANGNWDAAMIQTMMAMGVYLDDRAMFEKAMHYCLHGEGNGAINRYFNAFGQCQESGRDQGHTQMGLEYLANACEIAWKQGHDLYAAYDHRLALGFEYTARYNLGHDVPFSPYVSVQGRYKHQRISDKARGRLRPMYEKVYNHYHRRLHRDIPWTQQALEKVRREGGGRATLPWDTLMFANHPSELDRH